MVLLFLQNHAGCTFTKFRRKALRFVTHEYLLPHGSCCLHKTRGNLLTTALRDGYALADQTLFPLWGSADPGDLNGIRNITAGLSAAYLGVQLATADMWEDQDGNRPYGTRTVRPTMVIRRREVRAVTACCCGITRARPTPIWSPC
ncbi:hypothetical protein MSKU15_1011 [Komagataeibacter diospyri]|nr:hypothetical protein MSKU15_1011 [Komagataeibacter diospyri]